MNTLEELKKEYNKIIKKLNAQEKYIEKIDPKFAFEREITKENKQEYDDTDKYNIFLDSIKKANFLILQIEEITKEQMSKLEILNGF